MAQNDYINVFDLEGSYAGGEGFFKKGRYLFEAVYYTMFDFNGKAKAGEEVPALCAELQPLNERGKPDGELKPQYWPIRGEGVELSLPIKGHKGKFAALKVSGKYNTLLKGGEMHLFMEYLRKAEYDMDKVDGSDITNLASLDAEMDLIEDPYDKKKQDEADKKDKKQPRRIPVVISCYDGKSSKSKKDDKDTGKPASGGGKKEKIKPQDMSNEDLLTKYIDEVVDAADPKEETSRNLLRMEFGRWLTGDLDLSAEKAREAQELINDEKVLAAALATCNWKLKGKAIIPPPEDDK